MDQSIVGEDTNDASDIIAPNKITDDEEEYSIYFLYDNALQDGPILFDHPCVVMMTSLWEDQMILTCFMVFIMLSFKTVIFLP